MPSKPPEGPSDNRPVFSGSVLRRRPGQRVAVAVLEPEEVTSEAATAVLRRSGPSRVAAGAAALSMACGGHTDVPPPRGGPAIIGRRELGRPVASADERQGFFMQDMRTIVNLILQRPKDWNGMVLATDRLDPDHPLIDTRNPEAPIGAEAVQEIRGAVVLVLNLPRGREMEINIGCGSAQEGVTGDLWRLKLIPKGVMQTFGIVAPLPPTSVRETLYGGGETTDLAHGSSNVPLAPHWINGGVRPTAVGELRNSGPSSRLSVRTPGLDQNLVVNGKPQAGPDVEVGAGDSLGVVAWSHPSSEEDAELPSSATVEVRPIQ